MRGTLCGLVVSALLMGVGSGGEAWAQKTKLVVEQFQGAGADKLRQVVIDALAKAGAEVVPDKKLASTEADLGLLQTSDNYQAVAKELKVAGFVGGSVSGSKKLTAKVRARDAGGNTIGEESWSGANQGKLLQAVEGNIGPTAEALVAKVGSGGGKSDGGREVAKKSSREEKAEKKDEPSGGGGDGAKEDASVSASAEEDSSGSDGGGGSHKGFDVALGARIYRREFTYNESLRGGQQEYRLPAVPAPNIAIEFFPHPNVGVTGSLEYSVALISEDANGDRYRTKALAWSVGAKGRLPIGPLELTAGAAYGSQAFQIVPEADDPNPPQVAGVDYKHLRAGGAVRVPVSPTVAVIAGGNYIHLLTIGELKADYFPEATGVGGEGFGGVAFALPWMKGLEARVTADLRRYAFAMHNELEASTPQRLAGGAVDQYIGLNMAVAYRSMP